MSEPAFRPAFVARGFAPAFLPPRRPASQEPHSCTSTDAAHDTALAEDFAAGMAEGETRAAIQYEGRIAELEQRWSDHAPLLDRIAGSFAVGHEIRLYETVLALCETVVGQAAADQDALARRCETACKMLDVALAEQTLCLNPHDAETLRGTIPPELAIRCDPAIDRGGFRLETSEGGCEDGPLLWRERLNEALA